MSTTRTHQNSRGENITAIRDGNSLAVITPLQGGKYLTSCYTDYGPNDGKVFIEGGQYKTEAGALRRAARFVEGKG